MNYIDPDTTRANYTSSNALTGNVTKRLCSCSNLAHSEGMGNKDNRYPRHILPITLDRPVRSRRDWHRHWEGKQCYCPLLVFALSFVQDRYGIWIQGERSEDPRASSGLRVYGGAATRFTNVGDLISISGRVAEYRGAPNDLLLTEIDYLSAVTTISSGHSVSPLVLGVDRKPPNNQLSSLDAGRDGWLSIPNNVTLLESVNATLRPDKYGLDFWESLEGQLVTVRSPAAANFPDRFGSVWVYGAWPTTGKNERGGLTIYSVGK